MRFIVAIGPTTGGVGDAFRGALAALRKEYPGLTELRPDGRGSEAGLAFRSLAKRRAQIRAADVVHIEFGSNDLATFWCAIWCCLAWRPVVIVVHDPPKIAHKPGAGLITRSSRWRKRFAYRLLSPTLDRTLITLALRRSRAIVVLSEQARTELQARTPRPVLAAPHGAASPHSDNISPSHGEYVLLAGFLAPSKGLEVLLKAWDLIESAPLPLAIAGAGDPDDPSWLNKQRAASASSANPVQWLGPIPSNEEFQQLFARAALVVLPYLRSSPASGILVRAMTAGRPVIATPVPAMRAAINNGESGILVPAGDEIGLAHAISCLLADGALRDRIGAAAARRAAELFSWETFAARLAEAYAVATGTAR